MQTFFTIWRNIRGTATDVIDHRSIRYAFLLISIGGIGSIMSSYTNLNLTEYVSIPVLLLLTIILAPIFSITLTAFTTLISWLFGKLFKGTGTYSAVYKSISVGFVPYALLIPFYILWIIFDADGLFLSTVDPNPAFSIIITVITIICTIYSIVVQVIALSHAHKFSIGKAIATILIPAIVLGIIFTIIAVAIVGLLFVAV